MGLKQLEDEVDRWEQDLAATAAATTSHPDLFEGGRVLLDSVRYVGWINDRYFGEGNGS